MKFYTLYSDGSCSLNPGGTAAYGFVLSSDGIELERGSGVIGSGPTMSNNLAEYFAVAEGFSSFLKHYKGEKNTFLNVRTDSTLLVKQLTKKHLKTSNGLYYPQYVRAFNLLKEIKALGIRVNIEWVPRLQNQLCDDLSKAYKLHKLLDT